jgi:RecA/RadA recombinase
MAKDRETDHTPKVKDPFKELERFKSDESHVDYVRTGVVPLDLITLGKGWPLRRFIHVWAEPGVGKTTIIYTAVRNLIRAGEKVLWVGVEPTQDLADSMGLRKGGADVDGFLYVDCSFWDDLMDITNAFLNMEGWKFMVIDSLSAVSPDPTKFQNDGIEAATIAVDARIQKNYLRMYHALLKKVDKSIVYITHATTKIATMPGQQTKVVSQGGFSSQHFSDFRIQVAGQTKLTAADMGTGNENQIIGYDGWLVAEKNRHAPPFTKIPCKIIFGKGASNIDALCKYAQWRGFITGQGWYVCSLDGSTTVKVQGKVSIMNWVKDNSKQLLDDFYLNVERYFEYLQMSEGGRKKVEDKWVQPPEVVAPPQAVNPFAGAVLAQEAVSEEIVETGAEDN